MDPELLDEIKRAIHQLDMRVMRVESSLGLRPTVSESEPPVKSPPLEPKQHKQMAAPISHTSEETQILSSTPQVKSGGGLLGALGVFFFLCAGGYFVNLAIDAGWLTPRRQYAGLVLFSVAIIYGGFRLRKLDKGYAGYLPGCGIVLLYLSVFAGHLHFMLYSGLEAALLTAAVTSGVYFLYRTFDSVAYLVVALVGTYLVPEIVNTQSISPLSLAAYFLVWDLVFISMAIVARERNLIAIAGYMTIVLSFSSNPFGSDRLIDSAIFKLAIFQALQAAVFIGGSYYYTVKHRSPLTDAQSWLLLPLLIGFYGVEYAIIENFNEAIAPWLGLCFAAFLLGLCLFARAKLAAKEIPSLLMLGTFATIVATHSLYMELLPKSVLPFVALGLAAFLLWNTKKFEIYWPAMMIGWGIVAVEYLVTIGGERSTVSSLGFAALFLAAYWNKRFRSGAIFMLALGFLPLLQATSSLVVVSSGYSGGSKMIVSVIWAGLGLAGLIIARSQHLMNLASTSIGWLCFVSLKVVLFDLDTAAPWLKVVTLIVLGVVLYASGLVRRSMVSHPNLEA